MKRGDIWSAATGSGFGSKPRPVVIVQSDNYINGPNILVALCQTAIEEPNEVRPRLTPNSVNGLNEMSDVAVDLLVAVPRRKFGNPIGRVSEQELAEIDAMLVLVLGIAD